METVEYKNISFTVWDVGGQDKVCDIISFSLHKDTTKRTLRKMLHVLVLVFLKIDNQAYIA